MLVWGGLLLLLIALVALVIPVSDVDAEVRRAKYGIAVLFLLLGLGCLAAGAVRTVDAGHVGVPILFGRVQDEVLPEGMHFVNPLVRVEQLSVRTETYSMTGSDAITVLSSNGLSIKMDVTVPFRLNPDAAAWVYRNLGPNFVDRILRPAARTGVRQAAAKYTDQECYAGKREELAEEIQRQIARHVNGLVSQYGKDAPKEAIIVSSVMLRNVELPRRVQEAIERKLQADQEQQQMEFLIQREEKEARRKEIEARGIQRFQEIVSQGITPDLLKWKGIEATLKLAESPNAKIVIIGAGEHGLPLILGK